MSATPAAVVITNPLPATFEAVGAEALAQAVALAAQAETLAPATAEELAGANAVFRQVDALTKRITSDRMALTRPIDALLDAIRDAERKATAPLLAAKAALGQRLVACERAIAEAARAAAAKARQEAEERALAERRRLEAEQAAARKLAEEERAKAQAAADAEAAVFGGEAEQVPDLPPPAPVVVVPVLERPAALAVPVVKSAARTTTRQRLHIHDANLVPLEIAGRRLLVPDEKAIDALLRAGVAVPGARLVSVESIGAGWRP